MVKNYRKNFKLYLGDLAKRKPSPGGGRAVCLIFCTGVSLIEKAMNYSLVIKPKNLQAREKNKKLKKSLSNLDKLRRKIYPYIDKDAYIFQKIMDTKGKERRQLIKKSEKIITDLAKASQLAFSLAKGVESGIKKSIISDFLIGLSFIESSLFGCILNLEANSKIFAQKNKSIRALKKVLKK